MREPELPTKVRHARVLHRRKKLVYNVLIAPIILNADRKLRTRLLVTIVVMYDEALCPNG
jgi:hypothetical protein